MFDEEIYKKAVESGLDYPTAFFMEKGYYPMNEVRCKYQPSQEDSFDLLNYLECNYDSYDSQGYRYTHGYHARMYVNI